MEGYHTCHLYLDNPCIRVFFSQVMYYTPTDTTWEIITYGEIIIRSLQMMDSYSVCKGFLQEHMQDGDSNLCSSCMAFYRLVSLSNQLQALFWEKISGVNLWSPVYREETPGSSTQVINRLDSCLPMLVMMCGLVTSAPQAFAMAMCATRPRTR